jgi:hypothetical protein
MQNYQGSFSSGPMSCKERIGGRTRCGRLATASRYRLGARAGGLTLACATLVAFAGCTSAGYKKGDVAAVSMQKAAVEVQVETKAIDQTMAALQDLVQQPSGDLRPAFKRFSSDLDRLVATAQRTESTGQRVREKNTAYFQAWDQQLQAIDYQHIRELGEARKAQVTNDVAAINRRYAESQAAVQPLISYLQDIRKALSADLTPGGLASMKAVVQNANDNVVKVQKALDALTAELTNSSARLASVARSEE